MATSGSRLDAVLRAGQARLAATSVGPHAKASWRLNQAQEAARQAQVFAARVKVKHEALARLQALAHDRFMMCLRAMTNAQYEFKDSLPGDLLDEWEEAGKVFPDPELYAQRVYDYTMQGEDQKALDLMREGIESSGMQPVRAFGSSSEDEDIEIIEAFEDEDDDDDDAGVDGDAGSYAQAGRNSTETVAYGLPDDDDDGVEEEPEDTVTESDEAMARRMQAEWNSRGSGRVSRRPPPRMMAGGGGDLRGKSNVKVVEYQ